MSNLFIMNEWVNNWLVVSIHSNPLIIIDIFLVCEKYVKWKRIKQCDFPFSFWSFCPQNNRIYYRIVLKIKGNPLKQVTLQFKIHHIFTVRYMGHKTMDDTSTKRLPFTLKHAYQIPPFPKHGHFFEFKQNAMYIIA